MRTFKDNADREWSVAINVETVKRVRDVLGFDLLDVFDGKSLERLARDAVLLVDVVYVVCQKEAEGQGVVSGEFGAAMAGDAIDAATKALLAELVDFFPSQSVRESLQTILHAMDRLTIKGASILKSRLTEEALDKIMQTAVELPTSAGD